MSASVQPSVRWRRGSWSRRRALGEWGACRDRPLHDAMDFVPTQLQQPGYRFLAGRPSAASTHYEAGIPGKTKTASCGGRIHQSGESVPEVRDRLVSARPVAAETQRRLEASFRSGVLRYAASWSISTRNRSAGLPDAGLPKAHGVPRILNRIGVSYDRGRRSNTSPESHRPMFLRRLGRTAYGASVARSAMEKSASVTTTETIMTHP